jgi:hypothetical protein
MLGVDTILQVLSQTEGTQAYILAPSAYEPEGRQYRYGDIQDQDLQLQGRGHRHGVIQMAENSTRDNRDRVEAHTASEAASVQTCHPHPLVWRTLVTIRSVAPTPTKQMKTLQLPSTICS